MTDMKSHNNDTKLAVLETENLHINKTLVDIKNALYRFETRFECFEDKIDRRFDKLDHRFDKLDHKIDKIDNRMWQLLFWTVGGFASVLGLIAHAMEWI